MFSRSKYCPEHVTKRKINRHPDSHLKPPVFMVSGVQNGPQGSLWPNFLPAIRGFCLGPFPLTLCYCPLDGDAYPRVHSDKSTRGVCRDAGRATAAEFMGLRIESAASNLWEAPSEGEDRHSCLTGA